MISLKQLLAPAVIGLALAAPAAAQDQEQMQKNFDDKMAKEFISNAAWVTDYDEAQKMAKEQGKVIFVYFTRSYAQ
jgi:type IV secretory pathway TraG/TraD family ATPase VirD4